MRSRLRTLPNRDQLLPQPLPRSAGPTGWVGRMRALRSADQAGWGAQGGDVGAVRHRRGERCRGAGGGAAGSARASWGCALGPRPTSATYRYHPLPVTYRHSNGMGLPNDPGAPRSGEWLDRFRRLGSPVRAASVRRHGILMIEPWSKLRGAVDRTCVRQMREAYVAEPPTADRRTPSSTRSA